MATIDYKQKIKDYMNSSEVDTLYKSMLNNLFPELAESEEERIRKKIIALFKGQIPSTSEEDNKKFVAWLEKQGEQMPAEEYNITGISSNKSQGKLGEIIKNLKTTWSEEDENYHRICLDLCTGMPNGGVYAPYIKDEAINWLKSIKDRVQPQPKQEWGEEDEYFLAFIVELLYGIEDNTDKDYESRCRRAAAWLKSLRPQNRWKPSEHEITVLEKIQHGEINPSNPTLHRVIKCLKKLMEE